MKVLLIVCVYVCYVLGRPGAQKMKDVHDECQSNPATHVDDAVFKAIHKGESFDRTLVGAHMLCMSTKLGTQNADGTINRQAVREALALDITDATKLEEVTDKCTVQGSSPGETALKLGKCIRDNIHEGRHGHSHGHHHGHHHDHV